MARAWALVWRLCEALWGRLQELEVRLEEPGDYELLLERRRAFSRWLSQAAAERIQEEVSLSQNDSPAEAVFSYLTGKQIGQACRLAQQSGKKTSAPWTAWGGVGGLAWGGGIAPKSQRELPREPSSLPRVAF